MLSNEHTRELLKLKTRTVASSNAQERPCNASRRRFAGAMLQTLRPDLSRNQLHLGDIMKQDMISAALGFRSAAAITITRIGIGLSCLAAFAAIPGLERMLGCLGFLGLIGIATVLEMFARQRGITNR